MMNNEQKPKLIIFTDSGDTIIDESTEIRNGDGIVVSAKTIPGAIETLKALYDKGYTIALVADGEAQSFENVYSQHELKYCFKTWTISEIVGKQKPARIMFEDAMQKNNLTDDDKKRIVMIGNNVKKDIAGANMFGITSILLDWSPRYNMIPESPEQVPDYIVHKPEELLSLIKELDIKCRK